MSQNSQTMLSVLLVVGLVVGAGVGYFMAPSEYTDGSGSYQTGYDTGYEKGFSDGQSSRQSSFGSYDSSQIEESISGLTTLVYGAMGASLIAALAAIVSLMQISRRFAG